MDDGLPWVIARYLAAYNRKDVPEMLACFNDDVVFENASNTSGVLRLDGKAALAAQAEQAAQLFSTRQQTVKRVIVGGDGVALEIAFDGVLAATGQKVSLRGASFFRLQDGLIAELLDLS